MASISLLLIYLLLGLMVAQLGRPPEGLAKSLNWWVLYIALPAVVLEIIPQLQFDTSLWYLPVSMWTTFCLSWWVFHKVGTRLNWSRGTIGAAVLTAGLCNSSFVGFPLIEALRGKQALTYAAFADQLGSFMNASIGGSIVVAMYSGDRVNAQLIARKIFTFPPFIALLVALVVSQTPGWPAFVEQGLSRVSATLAPLTLFSVGLQLRFKLSTQRLAPFISVLGWKLAIVPFMVYGVGQLLNVAPPVLTIALLESAMAAMVTAAILAEQGNLDPPLANLVVGVGILLSLITVPLWNLLV